MQTTIKLYGQLAEQFGSDFKMQINTVGEAFQALCANFPLFKRYMIEHSEPGYYVLVDDDAILSLDEMALCITKPRIIKIVPIINGAGDGKAILQIFTGVALLAAAFFTGGAAAAGFLGEATGSTIVSIGVGLGLTLITGGVTSLLSPVPHSAKNANNYAFANVDNTITQGFRVPICYGDTLAQGYPLSVRLVVE